MEELGDAATASPNKVGSRALGSMLDVAHRLLRKPLDAGELIEAVESVAELRELLTR